MSISVNVAVEEGYDFSSTVARAQQAGLVVVNLLEEIRVVSGTVAQEDMSHLRQVRGVTVEPDRTVSLSI